MVIIGNEEVEQLLGVREAIPVVESALRALGERRALSPARQNLAAGLGPEQEYALKLWAAVLPEAGIAAVRLTSAVLRLNHYGGRWVGEPVAAAPGTRYTGLIAVMSLATSEPLALVHDGTLNQFGTSVPAGIAAKYLARSDSAVVGVLGAGAQARQQLATVTAGRDVAEVRVFSPRRSDAEQFAAEARDALGLPMVVCADRRYAVEGCDIVLTATSAPGPVLEAEWIRPGTHVSVTRPSEVPDLLQTLKPRMFSAGLEQPTTSALGAAGALWQARREKARSLREQGIGALAEVVCGAVPGRTSADEITLYGALTGQTPGVVWAALGNEVLNRARRAGVGHLLSADLLLQAIPS